MSIRLHISGCHLSSMLSQIYHCKSRILILHPQIHILTPAPFQKMAKYLGVPLTLLFVSHPTSNPPGSPVNFSFKINPESDQIQSMIISLPKYSRDLPTVPQPLQLLPLTFTSSHNSPSALFKTYIKYVTCCSKLAHRCA